MHLLHIYCYIHSLGLGPQCKKGHKSGPGQSGDKYSPVEKREK